MRAYDRLSRLIEGDYVETVEGLHFAVKGLYHPDGLVIAYLRYTPDSNGDRERDSHRYRRVYDLDETDELLRKRYPQYLNQISSKGLTLQSVPLERVYRVYYPREHLITLIEKPETRLKETVAKFASALSRESVVSFDELGVSGSILVDLAKPTSDVDLVVYGVDAGRKVYDALLRLRESQEWINSYDYETVREVMRSRWSDTGLDLEKLCAIEARKVLHGIVEGRDYFVRLVRNPGEFERELASRPIKKVALRATIIGAEDSIFTPCTYRVEGCSYLAPSNLPEVAELISYRGKFTEQVGEGNTVEVRGTLEEVIYQNHTIYRVMLGSRGDYLVPIHILDQ